MIYLKLNLHESADNPNESLAETNAENVIDATVEPINVETEVNSKMELFIEFNRINAETFLI